MVRLATVVFAILIAVTNGHPHYQPLIPNGDRIPNPCPIEGVEGTVWYGVGHRQHEGAGPRNPFGMDFAKNDHMWNECLCEHDSDGDGKTNGEELGDPDCKWTPGDEPARTTGLSHPGICEPVDKPECMEKNYWLDCQSMVPFECPAFEDPETESVDLRIEMSEVPSDDTTYVCTAFTFPDSVTTGDFHMIGAEVLIGNEAIIHHIIVYGCPDEVAANVTANFGETRECDGMITNYCSEMIYLWAFGVEPDCFDPEYGVRLGLNGFKTVAMEFHWNNPRELSGEMDNSGVRFYYSPHLRPYDAQSLFIGQIYLELPPGEERVEQISQCPAECTQYMFPEPVFISQITPHMHLLGRGMLVQLIRNNAINRTLLNIDDFDYNNPRAKKYRPHVRLMPGDEIRVECYFDTTSKEEYTFWGDATSDEMCIAIVQYYPKRVNATDCWGWESEQANIGECGYVYGEETVYPCYAEYNYFQSEEDYGRMFADIGGAYAALLEKCDGTGLTCMEGCQEVIDTIKENACWSETVDGWTKTNLLPWAQYVTSHDEIPGYVDWKTFVQAFASCDEREHNDSHDDEHGHDDHDDGDDGHDDDGHRWEDYCVFNPPEPGSATVTMVSLSTLIAAAVFALYH